jgi:hypothetical protein
MKKIIFLLALFTISFFGCKTLEELKYVSKNEILVGIDFRKYTDQGFFITPEKYLGEYYSIGLISYDYLPAGEYKSVGIKRNPNYNKENLNTPEYIEVKEWLFEKVHVEQVMDSVYYYCTKLGADALVNFNIVPKIYTYGFGIYSNPPTIQGITISGFAVKRK